MHANWVWFKAWSTCSCNTAPLITILGRHFWYSLVLESMKLNVDLAIQNCITLQLDCYLYTLQLG